LYGIAVLIDQVLSSSSMPRIDPLLAARLSQIPVDESRSWNFEGRDTQYSTHCLHTYLAAMIPPLARRLIETYVRPGGSVLDPFCGGGAVLTEAILTGRDTVGCDVNDLAILVSRAKTTYIERQAIETAGKLVLEKAQSYTGPPLVFRESDYIEFWFKPYMLVPLTGLRKAVDEIDEGPLKTLFKVLFSAIVRNVSLTYRNEIRLRRMNEDERAAFNPDVFRKFADKLKEAVERVPGLPPNSKAIVEKEDTRSLPFRENEFDAIVCSPPYGDERNGVPYTQFAKNMLYWLGYNRDYIMRSKQLTLGWSKTNKTTPPSETLLATLEAIKPHPFSVIEAVAFYADYFLALKELARVARHRVIIVIGQRVLQNTVFDNARITAELMAEIGMALERVIARRLPTKRLPKMREFGAAINQENILIFNKS